MPVRKYELPSFLEGICSREHYVRWLQRKAAAHVKRDRRRGNQTAKVSEYKKAIHGAVLDSGETDAYTGEPLEWSLISTYDNDKSKRGSRQYKKQFASLPTVDHLGDGKGQPVFKICSWQTNDCKSDLDLEELLAFCRRLIKHSG